MKHVLIFFFLLPPFLAVAQRGKPVITGQNPISTNEDQPVTIEFNHLRVQDRNSFYPWGFTLTVYDDVNYSVEGRTVTPEKDFTGSLAVKVSVNDGKTESDVFLIKINVTPVNDPPTITGQVPLTMVENTSLTILTSHLTVTDADDSYPTGFSVVLLPGSNYSISGGAISPKADFVGSLSVNLRVNDGEDFSPSFVLKITVEPDNEKPKITGQVALSVAMNNALQVELSHVRVEDPDSDFPADFKLSLIEGSNYTISGTVVNPARDFVGELTVPVTVHDGHSWSQPFNLSISVLDIIHIKGQQNANIDEDSRYNITLSSLIVHDPKGQFPSGYNVKVTAGDNYTYEKAEIRPDKDYAGQLTVNVTISNGKDTSPTFPFRITVEPVNDAPFIEKFPTQNLIFATGNDSSFVMRTGEVLDADDTQLSMAQVTIEPEGYERGFDILKTNVSTPIGVSFNMDNGTLYLQGPAAISEYNRVLQSVTYYYTAMDGVSPKPKTLVVKVTDGKEYGIDYKRKIKFREEVELDIPTAFTPNDDNANDTWNIRPLRNNDAYEKAIIRVFTKTGVQVFETLGFSNPWDGRYRGQILPSDTYYYIIDFRLSSFNQSVKGVVSILR